MSFRKMESLILALAMLAPLIAAVMWIGEYWADDEFPLVLQDLPYLHVFFAGLGFWAGVVVTDLADPNSRILGWFRARFVFCTLKFRTRFDWNTGQIVVVQLKFKKPTTGLNVRVQRYGQNGWKGDQPHWSLLSDETLLDQRVFNAGSSKELVLSTRSLDSTEPIQFGNHEIPMEHYPARPHQKLTITVTSKLHGTISESRIVNYHPYPLSFITTLDQLDVIIQDSSPVDL